MPNHLVRGRYKCCRIGAEKSSKLIQPTDICPTLAAINNLRLILTPLSKSPSYTALLATDTSKVPSHLLIHTQIWTRETPALERDLGAHPQPPSHPNLNSVQFTYDEKGKHNPLQSLPTATPLPPTKLLLSPSTFFLQLSSLRINVAGHKIRARLPLTPIRRHPYPLDRTLHKRALIERNSTNGTPSQTPIHRFSALHNLLLHDPRSLRPSLLPHNLLERPRPPASCTIESSASGDAGAEKRT
jgi:hypothetical protein